MHWRKTWNVAEITRALRLFIMDKEVLPHCGIEVDNSALRVKAKLIRTV
ncbi:hypothetical protein JW309_15255 [Enterobacter bugandensis]|jgi:hypothetical protein|nr:hypothetical protein [Enterobacter bugandensis]MBW4193643.1 hypothetical protein [Enterobacter bugandensis]